MAIPPTKLKKWKVLQTKDVSPSKWMPVVEDRVELGNGRVLDFYTIGMGPASMVFPFTKEGQLVLVRQYKHGTGDIIIEGAAGMVEAGQSPLEAAVRELEEEAGIKCRPEELINLGVHCQTPTKNKHTLHGFLLLNAEFNGQQKFDEHEDIEVLVIDPKEALEMIKSGEIWASDTVAFILKIKLIYPELFDEKE